MNYTEYRCSKCKEVKPINKFYMATRTHKDGTEQRFPQPRCKDCYREEYYGERGITEYGDKRVYVKKNKGVNIKMRYNNTQINIDGELIKIGRWVDEPVALKLKRAGYYFIFSQ
jgi:hypothetical protein